MKKSLKLLSVALASIYLAGCSTYSVNNYGISASNVEQLKKFDGVQVSVNDFTASKPGLSKIQCRGAGPVAVSEGTTFESYIKDALVSELKLSGLYSENAPIVIDGYFEKIDFNSQIGSGKWVFEAKVSSNENQTVNLKSVYEFSTNWVADKACQQVAQAFVPAVQNLIKDLVSNPQFVQLANAKSSTNL